MTTKNDWQRFVAMMEKAGWHDAGTVQDSKNLTTGRVWIHDNGAIMNLDLGDWCKWLEADETPAPF